MQAVFSLTTGGGDDDALLNATHDVHHVLSGSFLSRSLFLLAFSPLNRTLVHVQTVPASGPHQYLALGPHMDRAYTTTWASLPALHSWEIARNPCRVVPLNAVPITATSSYINIPPPYTHAYSAGGPTGEVHLLHPATGALGTKQQELLFVPPEELPHTDKTRAALRVGSHGIEFTSAGLAFIPVLGTDTIEVYTRTPSGQLAHVASSPSPRGPRAHDGPRHLKVHPNGRILYCVTEHSNFVDVYRIKDITLEHLASRSLHPPINQPAHSSNTSRTQSHSGYRGGTLLLTPSTPRHPTPTALFTTTRGGVPGQRGWLSVFALDREGLFVDDTGDDNQCTIERWETPTSSGKANAIDILSKREPSGRDRSKNDTDITQKGLGEEEEGEHGVWILLTDDEVVGDAGAGVRVLEWDGWGTYGVRIVAEWPIPGEHEEVDGERMQGASHAVWL